VLHRGILRIFAAKKKEKLHEKSYFSWGVAAKMMKTD